MSTRAAPWWIPSMQRTLAGRLLKFCGWTTIFRVSQRSRRPGTPSRDTADTARCSLPPPTKWNGFSRRIDIIAGQMRAFLFTFMLAATNAAIPVPKVTGPLPSTADSYPFGAADHERVPEDLKKTGYVEEEFLMSGNANV